MGFLCNKNNPRNPRVEVVHQRSSVVVKLKSPRPIAPRPGVEGYEVPQGEDGRKLWPPHINGCFWFP